jgi:hypothetical protein
VEEAVSVSCFVLKASTLGSLELLLATTELPNTSAIGMFEAVSRNSRACHRMGLRETLGF